MIENKKHYPAICFTKLPNSAINHSIRVSRFIHTFATMALQNSVDIKTVSSMLDHYSAGLRWIHTPALPRTRSSKRRKQWEISYPVPSDGFRYPLPLGSAFGSRKSNSQKTELMKSKSPRNQTISRTFGTP